jgi:hypothetical protein
LECDDDPTRERIIECDGSTHVCKESALFAYPTGPGGPGGSTIEYPVWGFQQQFTRSCVPTAQCTPGDLGYNAALGSQWANDGGPVSLLTIWTPKVTCCSTDRCNSAPNGVQVSTFLMFFAALFSLALCDWGLD